MLHSLLSQVFRRPDQKPLRRRWAAGRDGQRLERLEPRSMFAANLAPVNSVPGAQMATVDQPLAFTAHRGTAVESTVFSLASVNAAPTSIDLGNTAWLLWCTGGQIWRSKPDGTDKTVVVAPSTGSFIACFDIDEINSRIYFTEELSTGASNSKIYSTALDGSDRQTIYSGTGLGHINYSLTVDATAGYVFLHSHDPAPVAALGPFYDGKIQRITIATGAITILPTTFWYAHDLEVSTTSTLFLAGFSAFNESSSRLYSQNVDGSANQELSVTGLATLNLALAERTNSLYVTTDSQSATTGNIYRVPSSGGDPVLVFDGSAAIRDVECDETTDLLYWITDTAIYRSTTKGTNAQAVVTGLTGTDNKDLSVVTSTARTLPETAPIGTLVGRLSASDVNPGDNFTYALVAGTGSSDNASFRITDGQLFTAAALDFETKSSYSVRIRATDQGGLFTEKTFVISVTNVNEAPTDVILSSSVIAENSAVGTTVGTFTTTDPDAASSFTYTLVAGTGSTDNAAFTIVGSTLKTAAVFDYEAKSSYIVRVRSTDADGLYVEKAFTILVTNASEPPTDIVLTPNTVAENSANGTGVGTLSTTDPDAGDTFTYTLVAGTGSADNASFTIVGNTLKTAAVFDYEATSTYSVRVRSTDAGGLYMDKVLTITIADLIESPSFLFGFKHVNEAGADTYLIDSTGMRRYSEWQSPPITYWGPSASDAEGRLVYKFPFSSPSQNIHLLAGASLWDSVRDPGHGNGGASLEVSRDGITWVGLRNSLEPQQWGSDWIYDDILPGEVTGSAELWVRMRFYESSALNDAQFGRSTSSATANVFQVQATLASTSNEAPTDIALSSSAVAENGAIGTTVGMLASTDPDAGSSFTYTLVAGTGSTDNAAFTIVGNALRMAAVPDFEVKSAYAVRVRSTDQGGLFTEKTFTIAVTNVNEAPVNIVLSIPTVPEASPIGTTVGILSTSDPDVGNTFTYSLVTGTGSTDNASFTIFSNAITTAATFDFEARSPYSIRVRAADQGGLTIEKVFAITITNINEAPTGIVFSSATVAENVPLGTTVGTLTAADQDNGNTFTYALVTGTGSTDNASFTVVGNALKTAAALNFETKASYSVRVRATDQGGLFTEKTFTISVTNVNETPTGIVLSPATVAENVPLGATVGTLTAADPDAGNTFTYALVAGTGSTDNASFTVVGNALKTAAALNFETKASYSIRVRATDQGGLFTEKTFTISVTNVNESPTDTFLSFSSVIETAPVGTTIGTLSTADPDAGDTFTYSLVAGGGSTDNASFTIVGNALKTATPLDFSTKPSYSVRVRSTDRGGLFRGQAFTITVLRSNATPTDIGLSASAVAENSVIGTTVGTLSTTDPDVGNTFTYSLVPGSGSDDNAAFTIVGNALATATPLNFEGKPTYTVRIRSTDQGNLVTEKAFVIAVTDLVEPRSAPTATLPAAFTAVEDTPSGLVFSGTPFADADSPASKPMIVTLRVADGIIAAASANGVTVGGTALARTFSGTRPALNAFFTAAPARITYTTAAHNTAPRTLTATIAEFYGTVGYSSQVTSAIAITPVNDAPAVAAPATFTVTEDVRSNLTWPALLTPFKDIDSPSLTVTLSVGDGTISALGTAVVAVGGTATARTFTGSPAGLNAYFKTIGAIGYTTSQNNTVARTLTTVVSDGLLSAAASTQLVITPVNDAPTISPSTTFSGGRVGTPYEITYESLRLAVNVADVETALPSIVITAIDSGIVQRWSGTAWVTVSMAATAPLAQRSLTPGQRLRWLPPASGRGDQAAFKVKSRDGALYSAVTAQVIVNLAPV